MEKNIKKANKFKDLFFASFLKANSFCLWWHPQFVSRSVDQNLNTFDHFVSVNLNIKNVVIWWISFTQNKQCPSNTHEQHVMQADEKVICNSTAHSVGRAALRISVCRRSESVSGDHFSEPCIFSFPPIILAKLVYKQSGSSRNSD